MKYLGIGIGIVVVLGFWYVSTQRRLVSLEELVKNAMAQIGVQMNSRWDALVALADMTKAYTQHEYETLSAIIEKRQKLGTSSTAKEVAKQESQAMDVFSRIIAVGEAYPDLKANTMYEKTMDSLNTYENQVRRSRMVYNDTVTKLNRALRQFPTNLIASMLGFQKKEYLETPESKTEMPTMV